MPRKGATADRTVCFIWGSRTRGLLTPMFRCMLTTRNDTPAPGASRGGPEWDWAPASRAPDPWCRAIVADKTPRRLSTLSHRSGLKSWSCCNLFQ